jgi:two-component system, chemotaxis family, protein-glutamate methylesterase/glutaminase
MPTQKIIVIGASAGGIEALRRIVAQFPEDFPAAIFITQHLFHRSETILSDILGRAGRLPVRHPAGSEPIVSGHIYLAPPDYHLVLSPGVVSLGHGPKENLQRPCINLMFRSAAAAYGPDVIGVLITGMLDDGASGLWEIKERGGVTIVQDPEEAAYRSMPESAIRGFQVDHIVRLDALGSLLGALVSEGASVNGHGKLPDSSLMDLDAHQSCPECGGVMTQARQGRLYEYRCHIGHRFGLKTMIAEKTELIERMVSAAMAQTEELTDLLAQEQEQGDPSVTKSLANEIERRRDQARELRALLESRISRTLGS